VGKTESTALLIDDDVSGLAVFRHVLRREGFHVLTAVDGKTGVAAAVSGEADVIVLDLRLPDFSGIEALRQIRRTGRTVPVILMTAYPTTQTVVQAMRLGAADYLEKPLTEQDLLEAVRSALRSQERDPDSQDTPTAHAAARWANAVVKVIDAAEDPRTLRLWGRHIGASPGSLRNWCRIAGLSPKRSLSVARMLRAVIWSPAADRPENLLNVTDRRTLALMLRLGNPHADPQPRLPRSIDEFLALQRWVTNPVAIAELKRALTSRLNVPMPRTDWRGR
jgi:FixJ family two-component response regulator